MSNTPPPYFDPSNFSNEPYVQRFEKPWGYELHWVRPDRTYMGKLLHINKGARFSLQSHETKLESWFLMKGQAKLIWDNNKGELVETDLQPDQGYSAGVGQRHRIEAITDCDIVEASMPEGGTTWRLDDDYSRPNETPDQRHKERGLTRADDYPVPHVERVLPGGQTVYGYGVATLGCTIWEHLHDVNVLSPDWQPYDLRAERFVLDWDDTCKDTGKYWIQAHREVLIGFNFDESATSDDAILALFGNIRVGETLGIEKFVKDGRQFTDEEVWGLIKDRARILLAENPVDPLLVEALKTAHMSGVRLAVWSSSPRDILVEAIEINGLAELFDAVIAVEDVDPDKHKPHTQGLVKAVKAMDVARGYLTADEDYTSSKPMKTNGVWMVGDSPNDVLAGKQAGTSTVWLENPLHGHNAHEKRQDTLDRVSEASDETAVLASLQAITPTVTIRTFDPEEAGYARNVAMQDLPTDVVRTLTTLNINFAKFLVDVELRAQLYRAEQVRMVLADQHILVGIPTENLESALYGESTTTPRVIAPREVVVPATAAEAQKSLERIIAKRLTGSLL